MLNVCDLFGMIGMMCLLSVLFFSRMFRICMNVIVVEILWFLFVFFKSGLNVLSVGIGSDVVFLWWCGRQLLRFMCFWCMYLSFFEFFLNLRYGMLVICLLVIGRWNWLWNFFSCLIGSFFCWCVMFIVWFDLFILQFLMVFVRMMVGVFFVFVVLWNVVQILCGL